MHDVSLLDELADSEICNLDVAIAIEEDVIELDISVEDSLFVDITESFDDLPEDHSSDILIQLLPFADVVEEVTTCA